MPPPLQAVPYKASPSAKRSPPVLQAARYQPKSPPPNPDTLVVSPPGVPMPGTHGPVFGGSYTPESTAGFVFSTYRAPMGFLAKYVQIQPAGIADRELKTFPRSAFEYQPDPDPPSLRVIGGHKGPGWFSGLQREDQWYGSVYKLNTSLKCYDYVYTG